MSPVDKIPPNPPFPNGGESPAPSPFPKGGESQETSSFPKGGESQVTSPFPKGGEPQVSSPFLKGGESQVTSPFPKGEESQVTSPFPKGDEPPVSSSFPRGEESQVTSPFPKRGESQVTSPLPKGGEPQVSSPFSKEDDAQSPPSLKEGESPPPPLKKGGRGGFKTHFGFTEVPTHEKAEKVAEVFRSVANKYDLMNDLMSFGLHRLWKKFTIEQSGVRSGSNVLDLAGGTGDLAREFTKRVGANGKVILADINEKMLAQGRERLIDAGIVHNIEYVQADAEKLPFTSNFFDCITIAFGLRNVTDKSAALRSMYRVLKPGGKLLVLEFSKPALPLLKSFYDFYSFKIIPKLGAWVCGDEESYQYLVESIRMHPDQDSLKNMMQQSGFEDVEFFNLTGGIVALHKGFKY